MLMTELEARVQPGGPRQRERRFRVLAGAALALATLAACGTAARASVVANASSWTYTPYRAGENHFVYGTDSATSVDPYGFAAASVSQVTGTMHVSSHGQFGLATVEIDERIMPGYTGTFTYTFELIGRIDVSPVPAPYLDATGYSMQFGVGAQPCSSTYVQNATAASTAIDRYLTGTCAVTKGQVVNLKISAGVTTSGAISSADFSNTGIVHIDVPTGQSLGYADSTFLSDPQPFETVPIPEPAGVASLVTGLILVALSRVCKAVASDAGRTGNVAPGASCMQLADEWAAMLTVSGSRFRLMPWLMPGLNERKSFAFPPQRVARRCAASQRLIYGLSRPARPSPCE